METLSEALGIERGTVQRLVVGNVAKPEAQQPLTIKDTPTVPRVKKSELEQAYLKVPTCTAMVNRTMELIMSGQHKIADENPKVEKYFHKFLENVGMQGDETHWQEIEEKIFKYQLVYGVAFVELVYNTRGNRIVDLVAVDPKRIDYGKTSQSRIALDEYGNPLGYTQTISRDQYAKIPEQKYKVPKEITLEGSQIWIPADRIARFGLYKIGDGFYPFGIVEPAYIAAASDLNIQVDSGKKVLQLFITHASCGDETHEPSPESIQNFLNILKEAKNQSVIASSYYNKIQPIQGGNPTFYIEFLRYFQDQQIAVGGVPKPYVTGQAEKANKATINKLNQMFEITGRDHIRRTTRDIEVKIFRKVARLEGFDSYPRYSWGIIGVEEDKTQKVERLLLEEEKGHLTKEEVQRQIRIIEEIPDGASKEIWRKK